MRLLVLLAVVALIVLVIWAARRRSAADSAAAGREDPYRVVETTSNAEAHVLIARAARGSEVLIGSIPVADADFDDRYAALVALAEDRATTLNASRQLHAS